MEIRELLKTGITQKKIAQKYDVHDSTISYIKNKKRWSHL
jgi:DNA invertase Pin-like site-specific DNA recombinase